MWRVYFPKNPDRRRHILYKLSRYWNRIAYFFIRLGQKMIWDQTGKNGYLLRDEDFASETSEAIMCDRRRKVRSRCMFND